MTMPLESVDVERFRGIVADRLGLAFEDSKLSFLADVLRDRLRSLQRESAQYLSRLESEAISEEEAGALARELTVGETYFFRNMEQFRAFAEIVAPERMRARGGERCLHVLSAGCASGEEAYTLAIILREAIADPSWTVSIRAVDLNPAALDRAARGRFSNWALRETPPDVRERWFRRDGTDYVLHEDIRRAVTFERRNITARDPELWRPGYYDAVFCRNVIMYFSPEKMRTVVGRIANSLAPGGYFFLGHAETLRGLSQDFQLLHTHDTFYYRTRRQGESDVSARDPVLLPPRPARANGGGVPAEPALWFDAIAQSADRVRALGTSPKPVVPQLIAATPKRNLGRIFDLLQLERFAEALELVHSMPPEAAHDCDVLLLTAVLAAHSGQPSAAAEVAGRLLEKDSLNAGAHYVLALSSEAAGDRAAAASHDNLAVYLDPDFAMPRLHLGLLAKRAGDRGAARAQSGAAAAPRRGRFAASPVRGRVHAGWPHRALSGGTEESRGQGMIEQRAHISERADGLRQAFDLSFVEARRLETKETEDLLAVEIGGDPYMLRLAEIAGFLSDKKVTRLPSSAPELSGVGGFRGAIMPVYDLAALLKYPPSRTTRWMVIAAAAPVALAFDEFDGHHRFAADEIVVRDGSDEDELLSHVVHAGQFVRPIVNISSIVAAIQHHAAAVGAAQEH